MDKALTVIIPAYNVSQYIAQGVDSILAEPSIFPYLDIIIVNDGSTDDTLDKANKYVSMFPGCVSVIDKQNGGHGSGINVGIKAAQGKYLKILDGDDWVKSEGLKELVDYIVKSKENPDAIINPFEKVWEDGKREIISFDRIKTGSCVGFKEVVENSYTLPLHTLTIKAGIYRDYSIPQIDEKISYDDMEYILYPVPFIKTIVFLEKVVYEYRLGLSGQSMNPEQMKKKLPMHTRVINSLAKYYREKNYIFDDNQAKYYVQEFVDTLGTNCDIQISVGVSYSVLMTYLESFMDFPLTSARKKALKYLMKYKYLAYMTIKIKRHITSKGLLL